MEEDERVPGDPDGGLELVELDPRCDSAHAHGGVDTARQRRERGLDHLGAVGRGDEPHGFFDLAVTAEVVGVLPGDPLDVVVDVMESYPEKCVEVCVSGNLDIWLHDALPFGLAIFDDRIGVAVADPESGALRSFVDTDDPAAREWAETIFEAFREEAVYLEEFTKRGLREALATG